jgi:hypothetical protein
MMDLLPPPPGITVDDTPQEAPPPVPVDAVPPGITLSGPPVPQGITLSSDAGASPPPKEKTNVETPGIWEAAATSYSRNLAQNVADTVAGGKVSLPEGLGGSTLEQQYQQGKLEPQTADEVARLAQESWWDGIADPKWYAVHIAGGFGAMTPSALGGALPGAIAGGLVGGPVGALLGGAAGFAIPSMFSTAVPAYKAARTQGLDPDQASTRALIDTGIAGAGSVAMGLAPGYSLFGRAVVDGTVATVMKRPFMEALAQLGFVQPGIADTEKIVTSLSHGELPTWKDIGTTTVEAFGMGGAALFAHGTTKAISRAAAAAIPEQPPASPERIHESFENQKPDLKEGSPPPEGVTVLADRPETPEERIFFSPLAETVRTKVPDNASVDQVLSTLRNAPGVKEEEIQDLQLPNYLASVEGRVNKEQLLAHIESNGIVLEERHYGTPTNRAIPPTEGIGRFSNHILPGDRSDYREIILRVPSRSIEPQVEDVRKRAAEMGGVFSIDNPDLPEERRADLVGRAHRELSRELNGLPPVDPEAPLGWDVVGGSENPRDFHGGHFPDPNIIAHIRATRREDANGKEYLHIEEIQSDWHQEGRKRGYKREGVRSLAEVTKALEENSRGLQEIRDQRKLMYEGKYDLKLGAQLNKEHEQLNAEREALYNEHSQALTDLSRPPNGPFKSSWEHLAFKRMLRYAAENGIERMSWANGDQVGLRLASPEELRGAREAYDVRLPSFAKKWAKTLAVQMGTVRFAEQEPSIPRGPLGQARMMQLHKMGILEERNRDNRYIEISPAASEKIRQGLPLYDKPTEMKVTVGTSNITREEMRTLPKKNADAVGKIGQIIADFGNRVGMKANLVLRMEPNAADSRRGYAARNHNGSYEIFVNTARIRTPEELYAVAAHEFGHVVMWDKFQNADLKVKNAVFAEFEAFQKAIDTGESVGEFRSRRDNAITEMRGTREQYFEGKPMSSRALSEMSPTGFKYVTSFEEWFAEQVAKWGTTEKPLSSVDKFFSSIGKTIRELVSHFTERFGFKNEPTAVMKSWLDSMMTDVAPFAADIKDKLEFDTQRINQNALDRDGTPQVAATPQTGSTGGGRNVIGNLPNSGGPGAAATAAHADRINKFFTWMTSLPQIAEMNKHIRGLQMYKEVVALMNLEKNTIIGAAGERLKQWKAIRDPKQQIAIGKFIDDYMNGFFKDPSDQSGEIRRPTAAEYAALAKKHEMSKQSLDLFDGLVKDFDGLLERYREQLMAEAAKIKSPQMRAERVKIANTQVNELKKRPYMPAMRFGEHTITVYDEKGNIKHFETTDSLRRQTQIREELEKHVDRLPGDIVRVGMLNKDVRPLLGMPSGLLSLIDEHLALSDTQRAALDQLKFEYSPVQSFKHRFTSKDVRPGYSTDWQRAYASFFFHGANHFTRVKYVDKLRQHMNSIATESLSMTDAVKRDKIRNYVSEHLNMLLDPKPDFAAFRGLMFHWYLGFGPKAAVVNLTQTPIMTYPHLASKFGGLGIGDLRAMAAIGRASTELNNFYKKGTLVERGEAAKGIGPSGAKARALSEAVKEGVISETQAHALAAVSEGRNLGKKFGTATESAWHNFSEASSWMFEMTEQYNRRVAFRAAWDLSMRDPNNKYVQETVRDNPLQYKRLIDQGWSHQEASAFTAAKDSVEKTQFVYAPYARPKFMWGRKGSLFIFKSFTQNTLFNLWANKAAGARSLLILGAVGGMMGLPGMEDVNGLLKALAFRLFGKDFDLEDEGRKFAIDVLNGGISPDVLLHGTSVKGFGIPAVMDALGHSVGIKHVPVPVVDLHGSMSMGNVLPFEPGKLFGAAKDIKGNELRQIQRASGAGFGLGFALYNFLTANERTWKTWEQIMPGAMSNLSHAWRYGSQGAEKTANGAAIVRFDITDTEQAAEVLARAMGFQPRRLTAQYESISAKAEAAAYWDIKKQLLLRQFAAAVKGGDPEDKQRVLSGIKEYNNSLPAEAKAKAITAQVIKESVMTRFKSQAKAELGLAQSKQNQKMFNNMDKYFPDAKPPGLVNVVPVK